MALYTKITRKKTINQFLFEFLTNVKSSDATYGAATYTDKECTELHCQVGKWRGFDDILELTATYYPSITKKRLMHILVTMKLPANYTTANFGVCTDTGILRFMFYSYHLDFIISKMRPSKSKYTWEELFKLLDIYSLKDYNDYKLRYEKLKMKKS